MLTNDILQLYPFQVVPDPLVGVQLGGVGWQLLQMDSCPAGLARKALTSWHRWMGPAFQMTSSRTEMWVVRCLRKRAASLPRKGRSRILVCSQPWAVMPLITDRWSRLSGAPEKRGLAPGGIGLYHQGQQVAAGLVYEDHGPVFVPGLFSGQASAPLSSAGWRLRPVGWHVSEASGGSSGTA